MNAARSYHDFRAASESGLFQWDDRKREAAMLLGDGHTYRATARAVGVSERTLWEWRRHSAFVEEVDRLSLMTDIASRAERLRIVKRVVMQRVSEEGLVESGRDLLDWLRFAQSETEGIKLHLALLADMEGTTDDHDR
jgi:transposase-like protein